MEIDSVQLLQESWQNGACSNAPCSLEFNNIDLGSGDPSVIHDMTFSIPGIDEAMGFAELLK